VARPKQSANAESPCDGRYPWVLTSRDDGITQHDFDPLVVGKWLFYINCHHTPQCTPAQCPAALAWSSVAEATRAGRLGISVKMSTDRNLNNRGTHVICVYTEDWLNSEDVLRVADQIDSLNLTTDTLYYKPDLLTLSGRYHETGPTSIYRYSKPGEWDTNPMSINRKLYNELSQHVKQWLDR
jgi:hypothetical protein